MLQELDGPKWLPFMNGWYEKFEKVNIIVIIIVVLKLFFHMLEKSCLSHEWPYLSLSQID